VREALAGAGASGRITAPRTKRHHMRGDTMKDDVTFRPRQASECDTANCRRLASIIISIELPVAMCSWCAFARHEREVGARRWAGHMR
jgi:hypothetical protein